MVSSRPSEVAQNTGERVWHRILRASMALPGAKVNRGDFLYSQLISHCGEEQVRLAIASRPAVAGIPDEVIGRIADSCIRGHVLKASGISFATGLPGGLAMAGTIPADMVQYYWHVLVLAQKLAYLYGWPDLLENSEVDEQTELYLTLLVGAMMGAQAAQRVITQLSERFALQVVRRLPRKALTKYAIYNVTKQVAKWIGISITKSTFARSVSKVVPVIGGLASAGVTASMMMPTAKKLKKYLRGLNFAKPDLQSGEVTIDP